MPINFNMNDLYHDHTLILDEGDRGEETLTIHEYRPTNWQLLNKVLCFFKRMFGQTIDIAIAKNCKITVLTSKARELLKNFPSKIESSKLLSSVNVVQALKNHTPGLPENDFDEDEANAEWQD